MFSRADWTLFRNLNTISQKAGVAVQLLRRLVLKELVDNALDCSGNCTYGKNGSNTYWVLDEGPGLRMSAESIAHLFSINRPLTSSKVLRLPLRGALGNGLRVVVGTIMATGGNLVVETGGKLYQFVFDDKNGQSVMSRIEDSPVKVGTKITYTLGASVPFDADETTWAKRACTFKMAKTYHGKSSPFWYDSDSFFELLQAAEGQTLRWLVPQFEGMKEATFSNVLSNGLSNGLSISDDCASLTREQADDLLTILRTVCPTVSPKKIGEIGFKSKAYGEIVVKPGRGRHEAIIPYVVEATAIAVNDDPSEDTDDTKDSIMGFVNATPITGRLELDRRSGTKMAVFGCGLQHYVNGVSKRKFNVFLNVCTPYMPICTDGKEPNFKYYLEDIQKVVSKSTKVLKAALKRETGAIKDVILENICEAIQKVSDNGKYRYSLRQLFYALRPYVLASPELGELDYGYFARVIGEYESEYRDGAKDLKQMYRDPRGTLYHPHTGESIPVGTISVEQYRRPEWKFNKILYIEKEGLFEVLKQVRFPERFDCALLSSKGFASRAVRDVIDLIGDTGEAIQFFCIHDSDGPGTMIYQALQEGTIARAARRVEIINLGLDPWEARSMALQVERFDARKQRVPVARYVKRHESDGGRDMDGDAWDDWLQTSRVELNAMTSPQFVAWLEGKMKRYNNGKVVPPESVLRETLRTRTHSIVRARLAADILKAHGFDQRVDAEMGRLTPAIDDFDVHEQVSNGLTERPENTWTVPLEAAANSVAGV